jgi:hypothetical protein
MKTKNHGWHADFPLREEAEDFSGKTRTFLIDCHETAVPPENSCQHVLAGQNAAIIESVAS